MSVLEQGHIYFFYRPRVETHEPESVEEIQRLYMILHPRGQDKYRMLVIGHKKLPDASEAGKQKYWAFIDRVVSNPKQLEQQTLKEQPLRHRHARRADTTCGASSRRRCICHRGA